MENKNTHINPQLDPKNIKSKTQQSEEQNQTSRIYNAGELSNSGATGTTPPTTGRDTTGQQTSERTLQDRDTTRQPNEEEPGWNENEKVNEDEKMYVAGKNPQHNNLQELDNALDEDDKDNFNPEVAE